MTPKQIKTEKNKIDKMSPVEMAKLYRFSFSEHPYFDSRNNGLAEYFRKKFEEKGAMTPAISKEIGWQKVNETEKNKDNTSLTNEVIFLSEKVSSLSKKIMKLETDMETYRSAIKELWKAVISERNV